MSRVYPDVFLTYRKRRRDGVLRKMAAMRAAKERLRLARGAATGDRSRSVRWRRFEYRVRDKTTGETHWRELVSARQAGKALGLVLRDYERVEEGA